MKRSHINFCKECRKAFEIHDRSVDFCVKCCILNEIRCGDYSDVPTEYENQPEIVTEIMRRYMIHGYE